MTHEELRRRTAEFARRAGAYARPLLGQPGHRNAASQLIRASESVASNYRAAGLGRSHAEFTATIGRVYTEADESLFWLEHLRKAVEDDTEASALRAEASALTRIFNASYHTAKRRTLPARSHR